MKELNGGGASRSYNQYCAVARALDLVGERWTLLIIRDLLLGPRRYKDLLDGLPGIGTNLLADRLRELEKLALVQRSVLPPPAGSAVYELTEAGQELEPVIAAMGRWGARFLGAPRETDRFPTSAYFVAMRVMFRPEAAAELTETYELWVDGHVFEVRVDNGQLVTREGRAHAPRAVMTMDVRTLLALLKEGLQPRDALASGRLKLDGDPQALERFFGLFSSAVPSPA